jgi:hypothetical protein
MSGNHLYLTREELYKKVWAVPMKTAAEEFGLSPSSLTHVCRKHNIPVPPVGHWTKIQVGHKMSPPTLMPELSGNERVHIYVREKLNPELAALAAEAAPKIEIPREISHALTLKTEKLLAAGKENDRKLLVPKDGKALHILVSRQQLTRALRIMNALFLALEQSRSLISWPKKEDENLTASIDGEAVALSLHEILDSERHGLTPAEQKHPSTAPEWDYKLSGRLRLSIDNLPYGSGPLRSSWADGRVQILENCLGDFIVGVKVAAAAIKKHRIESEEWARRREQEARQREEERKRQEEHKRKAEFITELMEGWEEAERIRAFLHAMSECAMQLTLPEDKKHDIQQVLGWIRQYAESLDPLLDLPDSIDEFLHPEKRYPWLEWQQPSITVASCNSVGHKRPTGS